ncbi:HEAT repeat domain-containing protein [Alloacidobacterium dinghuense]|uniref:HEAT repeat domain-containing protein n=1 Tax=Alloacidobacterium dinghuense TaxID=2763107 RepID=A0A7G8BED8_9BACT|nr:HEAT repeat domain-containing protein [Alloacidobacterium dinghuense]QNI30908.1 HEAT repeat domain-containing protein [Alloacidobacterium dinghuense]
MRTTHWFWSVALCGALLLPVPGASALIFQPSEGDAAQANAREDQLYADATRAINESRWSDAESLLNQVVDQHGRRADGALYWKAYAENKEGNSSDALKTCSDLRLSFPKSNWLKECNALEIEIRGKSGSPVQPQAEQDEDLKLLALNSLMQSGDANALPILQHILEGQQSERLKERALFVLAQDQSKQAQDLLGQIIRGEKDPNLQVKAINLLAVTKGNKAADTLADIYARSTNESVKRAVLNSYLVMNAPDKLVQVAQHESDPELARHAISELGALGAVSQLSTLYQATSSKDVKAAVINAFVPAGAKGAEALSAIASSEQDPELRRKAIRNLGVVGGSSSVPTLMSIYSKSTDEESKKAVLDALFVAGDAHDLVALARSEKDPSAKRDIVGKLAVMHNKEATDYMIEVLNK